MADLPKSLPENTGLVFIGETVWPPALLTNRQAARLVAAPNGCGRPNADVLRRRIAVVDGRPVENWQIDFPGHFTLQEATLYEAPFAHLQRHAPDWKNPHANPALRRALARVSRYLAMPAAAEVPDWIWIEEELIPDASLVVVAREDDFTHGLLQSPAFAAWHAAYRARLGAGAIAESFPFPWPPATTLGALNAVQEEQRHAVARTIRAGNGAALREAVARAYGWAADLPDGEVLARLTALQRARATR